MSGSLLVYLGLGCLAVAVLCWVVAGRLSRSGRAGKWLVAGVLLLIVGFGLPARTTRIAVAITHLDSIAPAWQFNEVHSRTIAAPPEAVYRALELVRADEIRFFRFLTWIRRGGRPLPGTILDAAGDEPLIAVAVRGGFVLLVNDAPSELVFGSAVAMPPGSTRPLTPAAYRGDQPPGTVMATMNFLVRPEGSGSRVVTETRVYANNDAGRRRFAVYWRLIYPGSAIIRRAWLAAIARRAEARASP